MSVLLRRIEKLEAASRPPPEPPTIRFIRMVVGPDGCASSAIHCGESIVRSYGEDEGDFRERAIREFRERSAGPCVMMDPLDEDI